MSLSSSPQDSLSALSAIIPSYQGNENSLSPADKEIILEALEHYKTYINPAGGALLAPEDVLALLELLKRGQPEDYNPDLLFDEIKQLNIQKTRCHAPGSPSERLEETVDRVAWYVEQNLKTD